MMSSLIHEYYCNLLWQTLNNLFTYLFNKFWTLTVWPQTLCNLISHDTSLWIWFLSHTGMFDLKNKKSYSDCFGVLFIFLIFLLSSVAAFFYLLLNFYSSIMVQLSNVNCPMILFYKSLQLLSFPPLCFRST